MTQLAIAVTIRPGATPGSSTFVYAKDGITSPYLKDNKGDITLPGDKAPVAIRFRLAQPSIAIGGVVYTLSLPADAIDVRDASGKWPPVFTQPKLSGPPNGPHDTVEVVDQNDNNIEYKYTLKVTFTPVGVGPVEVVADDPKIRNGGDTRFSDRLTWPVLVVALVLVALVAWRIATGGPAPTTVDPQATPPPARQLDIMVRLTPKGRTPADGLFFSFSPKDFGSDTACYLDDAAGNISIPEREPAGLAITFHLEASEIQIGGQRHRVGFKLAEGLEPKAPHPFSVRPTSGPLDPRIFELSEVVPGPDNAFGAALVTVTERDKREYDYDLLVGLQVDGRIVNMAHDPKIRNGGNTLGPGRACARRIAQKDGRDATSHP